MLIRGTKHKGKSQGCAPSSMRRWSLMTWGAATDGYVRVQITGCVCERSNHHDYERYVVRNAAGEGQQGAGHPGRQRGRAPRPPFGGLRTILSCWIMRAKSTPGTEGSTLAHGPGIPRDLAASAECRTFRKRQANSWCCLSLLAENSPETRCSDSWPIRIPSALQ